MKKAKRLLTAYLSLLLAVLPVLGTSIGANATAVSGKATDQAEAFPVLSTSIGANATSVSGKATDQAEAFPVLSTSIGVNATAVSGKATDQAEAFPVLSTSIGVNATAVSGKAADQAEAFPVTSVRTPVRAEEAELLWSRRFGTSYKNAPSSVAVSDGFIFLMSADKLYKLNGETGKIMSSADMTGVPSFSYTPPLIADGVIYCPLNNGTVQAFDLDTLNSLWVFKASLGGQALSPIKYRDGCIFTGFWNGEEDNGEFVCIDVADEIKSQSHEEKKAKWTYTVQGGFYRTGSAFHGESVIVGTDDGTVFSNRTSRLLCFNRLSGKLTDSLEITGDQRSGITVSGDMLYFVTKAGLLYGVKIVGGRFDSKNVKKLSLGGASTSTPVFYNNRLYVGVQADKPNSGYIKSVDATLFRTVSSFNANGYPQGTFLLSDAYLAKTGKLYIYSTYNAFPGGITVYTATSDGEIMSKSELFVPEKASSDYSISEIVCDENGTLIYKNDSGRIFAVGRLPERGSGFSRLMLRFIVKLLSILRKYFG